MTPKIVTAKHVPSTVPSHVSLSSLPAKTFRYFCSKIAEHFVPKLNEIQLLLTDFIGVLLFNSNTVILSYFYRMLRSRGLFQAFSKVS